MAQFSLDELIEQAQAWQASDPDEATRACLTAWIASRDEAKLRACFEPPMEFGTAGLRGLVGPGPAQMNVAVIRRATQAVVRVVEARSREPISTPLVVGFDGRIDSERFAKEAVSAVTSMGVPVAYFDTPTPTPVVAFAGLKLGAKASMVVTASHNPKEYNGFKVYGAEGIQITPPFDAEVAAFMVEGSLRLQAGEVGQGASRKNVAATILGEPLARAYVDSVISSRVAGAAAADVTIAYSPLHGVGAPYVERAFRAAGYAKLFVEPSQREVDGHFSTLHFPNPEEASTLERPIALASAVNADVMLVNDPDADRMGAALPTRSGRFRILNGNEIGLILTDYLLTHAPTPAKSVVVSTLVSSPMAAQIARRYGAHYEATLTGFKWLWTAARMLQAKSGLTCAICWEEALGYSTHPGVRDKDGIAAALCFADWVSWCKAHGETPLERLGELYRSYGAWGSAPVSLVRPGAQGLLEIRRMLAKLASSPPARVQDRRVSKFIDYRVGASERPVYRGTSEMFVLELEGNARIVVRPSGTEPKLKLYVDLREDVRGGEPPLVAAERAQELAKALGAALVSQLDS